MKLTAKKTTVAITLLEAIGPRKKGSVYNCNTMLASILIKQKKAVITEVPDVSEAAAEFEKIVTVD